MNKITAIIITEINMQIRIDLTPRCILIYLLQCGIGGGLSPTVRMPQAYKDPKKALMTTLKSTLFMRIKTTPDCLAYEMGECEQLFFFFFLSSRVKQLLLII